MFKQDYFHERFRDDSAGVSSDRSFCIVFAAFFAIVGAYKIWTGSSLPASFLVSLSGLFIGLAILNPALAAPLNRLWMQFGLLLAKVANPVFLGLLYYSTIVPVGLFFRLSGKDQLRLKYDPAAKSYWIERTKTESESMTNQF